jgi:hypothetical protein
MRLAPLALALAAAGAAAAEPVLLERFTDGLGAWAHSSDAKYEGKFKVDGGALQVRFFFFFGFACVCALPRSHLFLPCALPSLAAAGLAQSVRARLGWGERQGGEDEWCEEGRRGGESTRGERHGKTRRARSSDRAPRRVRPSKKRAVRPLPPPHRPAQCPAHHLGRAYVGWEGRCG